jgi:integrase
MEQKQNTEEQPRNDEFLAFLKTESEHQRQNGRFGVYNSYHSAYASFSHFLQTRMESDVSFQNLTSLLIGDYEAWLQAKGLCKNTTSFYVRALQSVYYKAVRQGLANDLKPFAGVYRGVAKTVKRAIEPGDVCRLKALDIRAKLVEKGYAGKRLDNWLTKLGFARDIFLFCFCARGLTFVDLAYMQKSNMAGCMLVYVRKKTKQRIEVRIEPMMMEILERYPSNTDYLLPILSKTDDKQAVLQQYRYALCRYNALLKMLGEMIGGLKLTSYVSRHSWASTARLMQVPLSVISHSMGHDSERTTEIYLKSLECNIINKANRDLIADVFKNNEEKK